MHFPCGAPVGHVHFPYGAPCGRICISHVARPLGIGISRMARLLDVCISCMGRSLTCACPHAQVRSAALARVRGGPWRCARDGGRGGADGRCEVHRRLPRGGAVAGARSREGEGDAAQPHARARSRRSSSGRATSGACARHARVHFLRGPPHSTYANRCVSRDRTQVPVRHDARRGRVPRRERGAGRPVRACAWRYAFPDAPPLE